MWLNMNNPQRQLWVRSSTDPEALKVLSLYTIKQDNVNELYSYITGFVKNKNSHLYRINGVENHLL